MKQAVAGGNVISFRDNIISRIFIGHVDVTETFNHLFGKLERGLVAMGCVAYPDKVDWSRNSPLNEGIEGIHIGIGMGQQMPHIDFISSSGKMISQ